MSYYSLKINLGGIEMDFDTQNVAIIEAQLDEYSNLILSKAGEKGAAEIIEKPAERIAQEVVETKSLDTEPVFETQVREPEPVVEIKEAEPIAEVQTKEPEPVVEVQAGEPEQAAVPEIEISEKVEKIEEIPEEIHREIQQEQQIVPESEPEMKPEPEPEAEPQPQIKPELGPEIEMEQPEIKLEEQPMLQPVPMEQEIKEEAASSEDQAKPDFVHDYSNYSSEVRFESELEEMIKYNLEYVQRELSPDDHIEQQKEAEQIQEQPQKIEEEQPQRPQRIEEEQPQQPPSVEINEFGVPANLVDFMKLKVSHSLFDDFLTAAYFIKNVLNQENFSIKFLNSKLYDAVEKLVDYKVVDDTLNCGYIKIYENADPNAPTAYTITSRGEYYYNSLKNPENK